MEGFVSDSLELLRDGSGGSLSGMDYGKHRILLEQAEDLCLAAVITGRENC